MVTNFVHHQSAHCENGVASNLLRHKGVNISEPMVFGIGSGLFFFYFPLLKVNYAPAISYRPMPGFIFNKAAKRLGIKVKRIKFSNSVQAQRALEENLKNKIPTGLQVGVYNLTYFPDEYRFHFNAHNLVVYGKENDVYLISDPVMEKTTILTEKELDKVRFAKGALAPKGHMYYPIYIPKEMNWDDAIKACKSLGNGWRLPNKDELNLLFQNKYKIGVFANNYYWSSTEGPVLSSFWFKGFVNGSQSYCDKSFIFFVRAVRDL
jgi:hypothetical protein